MSQAHSTASLSAFRWPVRVYWEDTDTSVLRVWTAQQRVVTYGHASIDYTVF